MPHAENETERSPAFWYGEVDLRNKGGARMTILVQ